MIDHVTCNNVISCHRANIYNHNIKAFIIITVAFIYVLFNNVHTNYLLAKANIEDVKEQVIDSVDIPPQLGEATDANVESYLQHFLDLEKACS